MIAPVTYARAGRTPGWERMSVFDRDAGDFVKHVVEVHAGDGWMIQHQVDEAGNLMIDTTTGQLRYVMRRGRFAIFVRPKGRAEL
jgi:hypothetical protein